MTKQITEITPEQAARMPEWSEHWIKIGLNTERADFVRSRDLVAKLLKQVSVEPTLKLNGVSTYGTALQGLLAVLYLHNDMISKKQIAKINETNLPFMLAHALEQSVEENACEYLAMQLHPGASASVIKKKKQENLDNLSKYVTDRMIRDSLDNFYGGQFYVSFVAYVTYIRDVLGWDGDSLADFVNYEQICQTCGYVWMHNSAALISDRPIAINRDERGRLHGERQPSLKYADGWQMFSWHGIDVPKNIIMQPETITESSIDDCENQEVRRCMIEIYGYERYVTSGKIVHSDNVGTLRKKTNKKGDTIAVVEVVNGSPEPNGEYKKYFLSVPPEMNDATRAVAWTYGLTSDEDVEKYRKLKVRT